MMGFLKNNNSNNNTKKKVTKEDEDTSKFFIACQEGNLDRIKKYILQRRIPPNFIKTMVDEYGRTPIHIACEYGHVHVVRFFLYGDPKWNNNKNSLISTSPMEIINLPNETGSTPLLYACRRNQLHMVQYLVSLEEEERMDSGKHHQNPPHHHPHHHRIVNVRATDHDGHTALHFAAYFGYIEIIQCLLQVWPENIHVAGKEGHTILHVVAEMGHFDLLQYLIEKYDTINPQITTHNGMTPLHFACQKGHLPIVKYLVLNCQVNMNTMAVITSTSTKCTNIQKSSHYYTAYDLAVQEKRTAVMEFLHQRRTLIHLYFVSIENGNYSSFLKCIHGNNGSNNNNSSSGSGSRNMNSSTRSMKSTTHRPKKLCIDVATTKNEDHGNMALHVAVSSYRTNGSTGSGGTSSSHSHNNDCNHHSSTNNGYIDIIHYILNDLQISIDVMNDDGWTALHMAGALGHLDVLQYLVDVGRVDLLHHHPHTKDDNGDTVLHLASRNGHVNVVQYLIANCGVSIISTNQHQQTPHEVAVMAHQTTVMEYYTQRQEYEDELFEATQRGDLDRMKACVKKNEFGIDVTSRNINQSTVLHFACRYGHLHIVRYLTQLYDDTVVNVTTRNKDGFTPLHFASGSGHLSIVKYLMEEEDCLSMVNDMTNDGATAYDLALSFDHYHVADYLSHRTVHQPNNGIIGNTTTTITASSSRSLPPPPPPPSQQSSSPLRSSCRTTSLYDSDDTKSNETMVPPLDPEIIADRERLENVIDDPTADPIVIGLEYLNFCTNHFTSKMLGEGAFGKVYLGYDHALNNVQLAIKRIRFDVLDENKMNQITLSFRREISVLKRFRHPNIVILYGYNVQLQQSNQFLVYEYLANGSLNTYLMDEKGRTRLQSPIRLSIMFQIARSIHFLHTGGCDHLAIYHRDIKAGNICLTKDYTAKLIDCGLAKFVPDHQNAMTPGSVTPTILNDSGAISFGTPGYICPIYSRGHVSFSPACDVFSLGVVFAELIVGCLQGDRSTRGTQNFGDYFSRYIRDDDDDIIENGWQILIQDSDPTAEWNEIVLERISKVAVKCMAASPKRRYSTSDLVEELSKISSMNFSCMSDNECIDSEIQELTQSLHLESGADVHCVLCNRVTCRTVMCTDGHHMCVQCAEQGIQMQAGCSGEAFSCKCGIGFHDSDLYGKITSATYHLYVRERGTQIVLDKNINDIKKKLDAIITMKESTHDAVMTRLKSIDSKIQRVMGGLAYVATNSVQECPTLIWLVPADGTAGTSAKSWKEWTKGIGQRRYDLYFICQHSFEVVDKKLGISVARSWLVQAAPVLYLSLFFLRIALTIGGLPPLPFPIQKITRAAQIEMNEDYVEDLLDDSSASVIDAFKTAYSEGSDLPYVESSKLLTSMSASYEGVVKKATSMRKCVWKDCMEPVVNHLGSIIWIKKEYRGLYM